MKVLRTAVQAPLMNAVCERLIGSVRRECLDHVIIFGIKHLDRVLTEYCAFFNICRPHHGIGQRLPVLSPRKIYRKGTKINSVPVLGGLHHDYWVAAGGCGLSKEPVQACRFARDRASIDRLVEACRS